MTHADPEHPGERKLRKFYETAESDTNWQTAVLAAATLIGPNTLTTRKTELSLLYVVSTAPLIKQLLDDPGEVRATLSGLRKTEERADG